MPLIINLRVLVVFRNAGYIAYSRSSLRPSEHKCRQLTGNFMVSKLVCGANLSSHIVTDYEVFQSVQLMKFNKRILTHKGQ